MWSDPIDNTLGQLQALLDQPTPPTAVQIERAKTALIRARECREFEKAEDRLVTPLDRF